MQKCDMALKQKLLTSISRRPLSMAPILASIAVVGLMTALPQAARAFNLYDGSQAGNNLEVNLTTTLSYSGFYRVNDPSSVLTSPTYNPNGSEGDIDFRHGVVGNLFDVLPVLDIKDGNYGAHVSGEMYINTSYLETNQNNQPGTLNPFSISKSTDFTSATRNVNGENARLLDAFVFGRHEFADGQNISVKVGRQTLLWGQSLFFPGNGIAAGQAPVDIITAQNLPNAQAQQVFLPTGQVVLTYQPGIGGLTLQGYYQFEYQHDVFEGVGGYFASTDIFDKGGQRLILAPGAYLARQKDITPPIQNGQFGLSVQDDFGNYDVGLFALRYDDKAPEVYATVGPGFGTPTPGGIYIGNYQVAYPRDIQIYGASVSTTIGAANVAAEVSGRRNMPLTAINRGLTIIPATSVANANAGALYPVGSTFAAQTSAIYASPAIPFDPGGVSILGELEFNHVISVTANKENLEPGRQASAAAFEAVITPTYNDVLPSLEVTFPIGIEYSLLGRSQIDSTMQHGTGNFTFGVVGTYRSNLVASLTYKDYFGKPDLIYNELADRGYVVLNLAYSF